MSNRDVIVSVFTQSLVYGCPFRGEDIRGFHFTGKFLVQKVIVNLTLGLVLALE